jgi:hypothetical protein
LIQSRQKNYGKKDGYFINSEQSYHYCQENFKGDLGLEMEVKPNFFIVGGPRCGTTTLSRCLEQHSQVCFSKPKEPHYFSQLYGKTSLENIRTDYLDRFFSHAQPHHRAMGEGSTSYLYSEKAIRAILEFNPEAKFIVSVRNPIEVVHSFHYRLLYILEEDQVDFRKAWDLQEARAQGKHLPRLCRNPMMLQYGEVGRFGKYVEQLYQLAGPEKCMVVVFDDLKNNMLDVYKNLLTFINLDYDGRTEFPHKMMSKTYKFHWLNRLLWHPPKRVEHAVKKLDAPLKGSKKQSIVSRVITKIKQFNAIKKPLPPLEPHVRAILQESFSEDVDKLGQLLHRDLSHWKK